MNQLSGKYVNVVLSVECGRGMNFLKNSAYISGNFNNRILESDKVVAEECPSFNTELVWEVEKKDLRRIRSANQPLRIECLSTDSANRRERVGFALLSLRSAQIIPERDAQRELQFVWHKLIGCQSDKKKSHPELYISLALRDHLLNEVDACNSLGNMPYISEEDTMPGQEDIPCNIPIKYFEDGHIQIGENKYQSEYYFNLLVKEAVNLDTLLPEVLVFQQNRKVAFLSFKILGIAIKTKPFEKEFRNTISLNEKIVVNLMSCKDILQEYFKTQTIAIAYFCGQDKLGITSIDLDGIFEGKDCNCYFKFPSPNGIVPFHSTDKSPYISMQVWIEKKIREPSEIESEDVIDKPKTKTVFSNISKMMYNPGTDLNGSGFIPEDIRNRGDYTDGSDADSILIRNVPCCETKSIDKLLNEVPASPTEPFEIFEKYEVQIVLNYLIWSTPPLNNKLMFKFLHPRATSCVTIFTEIYTSIGEEIVLKNIHIKLGYVSVPRNIQKLLKFYSPRLVLTDENETALCEDLPLDIDCSEKKTNQYEIKVKSLRSNGLLAKIGVMVKIKQSNLSNPEEYEHLYLLPIILDEIITIKEIVDLQVWKSQERKRFDDKLDDVKAEETKRLEEEWAKKKEKLEEQLQKSVKKCHDLQDQLRNRLNTLKTEKTLERRANKSSIYVDIFTDNWKRYCDNNTKDVIEILSRAQRDNEHLKELVNKQRDKLNRIEKSALTKSQTTNLLHELRLLEEKFEDAQSAKKYFKEQWQKACDEIHSLRTEDIKQIQLQIKQSKEELSQMELEEDKHTERTCKEEEEEEDDDEEEEDDDDEEDDAYASEENYYVFDN